MKLHWIKKFFFTGVILFMTSCGVDHSEEVANEKSRLNFILIVLDTCRADRLGPFNEEVSFTPNLDALAAESVVFTNCLSHASATEPSHRSLFTGQYVHRHGNNENEAPWHSAHSLAPILKRAGWTTAAFVGGGPLRPFTGLSHGFETYLFSDGPWQDASHANLAYSIRRATLWLSTSPKEPYFLFVHGFDPHTPYIPPEPFRSRHVGTYEGKLDPKGLLGRDDFEPLLKANAIHSEDQQYLRNLYDAEVAKADHDLGKFIQQLGDQGLLDRSILVFTSDHGESLGEHDWYGHARMWEEQLKVPLMIRFPNGQWSARLDDPVQLIDVLPTILSAFNLDIPEASQGLNLMPRIRSEAGPANTERMRLSKFAGWEAIRFDDRWKLIFRRAQGEIAEKHLYDLVEDPGEKNDLYGSPEGTQIAEKMLNRYLNWRAETQEADRRWRSIRLPTKMSKRDRLNLDQLGYGGTDPED